MNHILIGCTHVDLVDETDIILYVIHVYVCSDVRGLRILNYLCWNDVHVCWYCKVKKMVLDVHASICN